MYRLNNIDELTPLVIKKMIAQYVGYEFPRLDKLKNYYMNKTAILLRTQEDESKPNNKIVHPYAQYITDTLTGYFMGEPVSYSSNAADIEPIQLVFEYNDEQDENMTLAKMASIYGRAWEQMYLDTDGAIRFCAIDPHEVIPVYGNTGDDLMAVVRFYKQYDIVTETTHVYVEVYTANDITYYKADEAMGTMDVVGVQQHAFADVPFIEYKNNDDEYGDFEGVLSLIDAYDKLCSDDLNSFEYFCDAYLALYGYTADADDIAEMKKNRVLLMDTDSKAEFLLKQGDSSGIETEKLRIERDIHKFAKCPDPSDENFGGNVSGVAMKYKLLGTENVGGIKERKFKKGLQRRLELLTSIMSVTQSINIDWRAIDITFTRNLPVNEDELSTMINALNGIVSKKTLVSQLPFVEDAEAEIAQLEKETANTIYYTAGVNPTVAES